MSVHRVQDLLTAIHPETLFNPFVLACGHGYEAVVREMLNQGATPDCQGCSTTQDPTHVETPFHAAARSGNTAVLEMLFEETLPEQLNVNNLMNSHGDNPLHAAVKAGQIQSVRWFFRDTPICDIKAPNARRQTGLHLAAESGDLEILETLVEKGGDLQAKNADGLTPLGVVS